MTFIAKDSYDKQELLDCGQGEVFGEMEMEDYLPQICSCSTE